MHSTIRFVVLCNTEMTCLCRREDRQPCVSSRICSCHFKDGKRENGPTIFYWNNDKFFDFESPEKKRRARKKILRCDLIVPCTVIFQFQD